MKTVLVLEDSPTVLRAIQRLFSAEPHLQPIYCTSYAEAAVLLAESGKHIFAALVDLSLPDALKGQSVDLVLSHNIPVIVLTGDDDALRREELMAKGIVDYVLKESQYSCELAFRLLRQLQRNCETKILIVDDSAVSRAYIKRILVPHLFKIVETVDGLDAIRIIKEQPDIDLMIVDQNMPGMSGADLVKLIRQSLRKMDLRIIGLSGDDKGSLSARFIKSGADDFLRKPFCAEELNCRVMAIMEKHDLIQSMKRIMHYDPLTGLFNRRAFNEQANTVCGHARNKSLNVTVAMLDLDYFKRINDAHGHSAGDAALVAFAGAMSTAFPKDIVGRLGGEEFGFISPAGEQPVIRMLEKLRSHCAQLPYFPGAPPLNFSAGIYHGPPLAIDKMLQISDERLYLAKAGGRARSVGTPKLRATDASTPEAMEQVIKMRSGRA